MRISLLALCLFAAAAEAQQADVSKTLMLALWLTDETQTPAVPTAELLGWSAPTEYVDGTPISAPITYNLYRSHGGKPYVRIRIGIAARKATVTGNIVAGVEDCFEVSAVVDTVESAVTLPVCVTP